MPDFKSALKIDPNNKSIRDQLNATVKLIRRIEFEKVSNAFSICSDPTPLIVDQIECRGDSITFIVLLTPSPWPIHDTNVPTMQAISIGETETSSARCLKMISEGSCPLDTSSKPDHMPLPTISPSEPNARYKPTKEFVEGMIESFKKGGKVPKRVAWEIILGVRDLVVKQSSLVKVEIHKGATCDVVGDSEFCFSSR